jgi:hypothetical protein
LTQSDWGGVILNQNLKIKNKNCPLIVMPNLFRHLIIEVTITKIYVRKRTISANKGRNKEGGR